MPYLERVQVQNFTRPRQPPHPPSQKVTSKVGGNIAPNAFEQKKRAGAPAAGVGFIAHCNGKAAIATPEFELLTPAPIPSYLLSLHCWHHPMLQGWYVSFSL